MEKRIVLAKTSDFGPNGRGQAGKQKVYEITIIRNHVTFAWGMAEKVQRQRQHHTALSHQGAIALAYEKVNAKRERGYRVILDA